MRGAWTKSFVHEIVSFFPITSLSFDNFESLVFYSQHKHQWFNMVFKRMGFFLVAVLFIIIRGATATPQALSVTPSSKWYKSRFVYFIE
jgi:hypothetical protein